MGVTRKYPEMRDVSVTLTPTAPADSGTANTGTLRTLLGRIMGAIPGITGKTNWYTPPDYTIAQLRAQILLGAHLKQVKAATTANIVSLSTLLTVDGITLLEGDRVLVKNQSSAIDNGIYVASTGAWARADDMNATDEFYNGLLVYVQSGTANQDKIFALTTDNPITLGVTSVTFAQFPPVSTSAVQGLVELATAAEDQTGTDATRASTPAGVRAAQNMLTKKADVRLASTANIAIGTGGLLTIDGVVTVAGDRVLVKNQTAPAENGIYVVAVGAWTRAADANEAVDFLYGQEVRVREGTQAGLWFLSSTTTVVVGTTNVSYSPSTSASAHAFWSNAHTDIDFADAPAAGESPVYDGGTSQWKAVLPAYIDDSFITGLKITYTGTNGFQVETGAAYIPGEGRVITVSSPIVKSGLSFSNNTWYYIYLYNNAGTPDVEINTVAPADAYKGTARTKGGPITTRRYLGAVRSHGTGQMYRWERNRDLAMYIEDTSVAPFRVLNAANSGTVWVNTGTIDLLPPHSRWLYARLISNTVITEYAIGGTTIPIHTVTNLNASGAGVSVVEMPVDSTRRIAYRSGLNSTVSYFDALGFYDHR